MKQNHMENATAYHWHKDRHTQPQGIGARDSLSAWKSVKMHYYKQVKLKEVTLITYFKTSGICFFFSPEAANLSIKYRRMRFLKEKWKLFLRHLGRPVMCISTFSKQVTSQCLPFMGRYHSIQAKIFIFASGKKFWLKSIFFLENVGSRPIKRIVYHP